MNGPAAVSATHENVSQTMIQPVADSPVRITRRMWTDAIAEPMTKATPSRTLIPLPESPGSMRRASENCGHVSMSDLNPCQ